MAAYRSAQPPADKRGDFMKVKRHSNISAPLMFVVIIVAIIFVMSVFFRVSDIRVTGNTHYTNEEIIRAIDIEEGDNLFFFDRFAAISRVFAKLPYIEEVTVIRKLPDKVTIEVTESTALAYIKLGDEKWTMDHNCKVLGKAADNETGQLVEVSGISPGTLLIGEQLTTAKGDTAVVEQLAEILYQIQERGLTASISLVDLTSPQDAQLSYGGRFTVKLGKPDSIEHKFGMLVSVVRKLGSGDVGLIDLSDGKTAHFMSE